MIDPTVQSAIVAAIAGVVVAATAAFANRGNHRRIDEVHEQVKNTHSTNLREDIDRMVSGLDRLESRFDRLETRFARIEERQ